MADHEQHEDQPAHHVEEEKSIDTKSEEHAGHTEQTEHTEHTSQGEHEEAPTTDSVDSSDHGMDEFEDANDNSSIDDDEEDEAPEKAADEKAHAVSEAVVSPPPPPPEESKITPIDTSAQEQSTSHESVPSPTMSTRSSVRSLTQRRQSVEKGPASPDLEIKRMPSIPDVDDKEEPEVKENDEPPPKSPLLTERRISTTSLDDVGLEDDNDDNDANDPKSPTEVRKARESLQGPPVPSKAMRVLSGLHGPLPPTPYEPPTKDSLPAPPPPPTRKLTSPFAWLSRNSSTPKETVTSPPLPPLPSPDRRNTVSSIATISSNPELMLSKLDETGDARPARNSLRDRFKLLRMREEAGITLGEEDKELARSAGISLGIDQKDATGIPPKSPGPLKSPAPTAVDHALAPGTASGISAGPSALSEPGAPVDWDLWQSVVYEGPAAVARTSAEELNRAIATGIPSAIRGVVWQVLAQSKNEELESVYRDLVARGTDKEKDRLSTMSAPTSNSSYVNGITKDRDTAASSASSIHSDHSTPPTTNGMRSPSPSTQRDPELFAKQQAAALAESKKKAKEDAAALSKLEKAIRRDLGARTSYSKFAASAGLQDGLFGVCKAYALFDEGVGYAQGMNFLAMPLLFNMPEEEAFCLLVRLMNQYKLRDLFIQDMPGLHKHLYQFERLLEDFEPALYCHLHRRQVTPHLYATQWFLTLFAYRFPLQLVLRIYDLILSEGLEAILKFGIVLMQKNAATLLGMNDMVALTTFLKDRIFDVYIDQAPSAGSILESGFFGSSGASIDKEVYRADTLVQDACAVKITPEILKTYAVEWEEKTKAEKERELELENLKNTNNALSHKVRRLEERVTEHDTEHAALATELVRTKVENEELRDENESLKVQVSELKTVVEKQPEEVEARLQSEMDRLMKRNQEVHEENSRLEEEMAEMEQTLVATKMQYAEINSSHEALTRKWTDLRKALD